ncbi:ABC transporter permease [Moorella sulfitireducens (nom. illeg.)]|uniref:ABC transporter permease n=1 Tax=Neomoorella sulfitireducens TaxID=2972948 RepID=UPI0021AC1DD7|nr:ABC transporter permease [Moorella sulfitireducens]
MLQGIPTIGKKASIFSEGRIKKTGFVEGRNLMATVLRGEHSENRLPAMLDTIGKKGLLPISFLLLWHWITTSGRVKQILLPSPENVFLALIETLSSGELVHHLETSLVRVMEGFALAAFLGIGLGMALGLSPLLNQMAEGVIQLLRPIPPIAWLPLAILWFGIEEGSKVFIITLGAFFPIFLNVLQGIKQTNENVVEVARVFKVPWPKFILKVIVPGSMPFVVAGLRIGLGYAWMCVVAAELSGGMSGIGYMLMDSRALARTDRVLAGMLAIGAVGKSMDYLLQWFERKIIRWRRFYNGI